MNIRSLGKGLTYCPSCFEGQIFQTCSNCGGRGVVIGEIDCPVCQGGGEIEVAGPCLTCKGSGVISTALMKLIDAAKHTGLEGAEAYQIDHVHVGALLDAQGHVRDAATFRQHHDGVTQYALAAFYALRHRFDVSTIVSAGLFEVLAFQWGPGEPKIQPAPIHGVHLQGDEASALILTGLSWGYGGEGPNGLATILHYLGKFGDHREALAWVAALNKDDFGWVIQ